MWYEGVGQNPGDLMNLQFNALKIPLGGQANPAHLL